MPEPTRKPQNVTVDRRAALMIAAQAEIDPRTVVRFMRGLPPKSAATTAVIRSAAASLGMSGALP